MHEIKPQYSYNDVLKMEKSDARNALLNIFEIECCPSEEELSGYEYVRESGEFNMITEMQKVVDMFYKIGAYSTIKWLQKCKKLEVSPWRALSLAYELHGSFKLSDEVKAKFTLNKAKFDMMLAQNELEESRKKLQKAKDAAKRNHIHR